MAEYTAEHEIGHVLVAASCATGSYGSIQAFPGKTEESGEFDGISQAAATDPFESAMVWAGGIAGEKVFADHDRDLPQDSEDYINWVAKSETAGKTKDETFIAACELLDTPKNHAAYKALKAGLEANNLYLDSDQVHEIVSRAYAGSIKGGPAIEKGPVKEGLIGKINKWLGAGEGAGKIYTRGKWRFQGVFILGLETLIAIMNLILYPVSLFGILLIGSIIILWSYVGFLHYTDTQDVQLNRRLSQIDSIALVFGAFHFCFLLWIAGHYVTLKTAGDQFESKRGEYNQAIERAQDRQVKLAQANAESAKAAEKRAFLEADAAYWGKPAPKSAKMQSSGLDPLPPLEKPKTFEGETAEQFLSGWDFWVRALLFGNLLLIVSGLIYLRNRTVTSNQLAYGQLRPATPHSGTNRPNGSGRTQTGSRP